MTHEGRRGALAARPMGWTAGVSGSIHHLSK